MADEALLAAHRTYLRGIVALQLWFAAHWATEHPQERFTSILRWRVDLLRKTVHWQGQGLPADADFQQADWLALEASLVIAWAAAGDAEQFEEASLPLIWPAVEANVARDLAHRQAADALPFGSLDYDPPQPARPALVHLHVGNALRPRSLLADPLHLPACLWALMDDAERRYGATALGTASWLNSVPRWLAFFPPEYAANRGPVEREVWLGLGSWGQFINAAGGLHEARAQALRATGQMPYPRRWAECTFAALRAYGPICR